MNLKEKYYFCKDDTLRKDSFSLKEIEYYIKEFESKSSLKLTEEHKSFLRTFPAGAYIEFPFVNELALENDLLLIDSIFGINISFFEDINKDARNLNLIPFVESSGNSECYIGGGKENFGDVYFCEFTEDGAESSVLICKGFDTFMSGYKKREGYD